jgi:cytochrome c556
MGTHFGRIAAMAQGKVAFDAKAAADNAAVVVALSKLPYSAFVEGSDKGGNTKAKPEIWSQRDKFNSAATKMQDEVAKLEVAAKTGNFEQIKTAVGAAGKSCKGCHDDYKEK